MKPDVPQERPDASVQTEATASVSVSTNSTSASASATPTEHPTSTPILVYVESLHPYPDSSNEISVASVPDPNAQAGRYHFSRIALEKDVDYLVISDAQGVEVQRLTGFYPAGVWSDLVPGSLAQLRLVSDASIAGWGFAIDDVAEESFRSLGYSSHPYENGAKISWQISNIDPNTKGTRLHFSRVDLEENVDWLVIADLTDTAYQWITGHYPNGIWTTGVPGNGAIISLISDGSVNDWGFNIDGLETSEPGRLVARPVPDQILAESTHPHAESGDFEWTVVNPDSTAVNTKVHFERLNVCCRDRIVLTDADGREMQWFGHYDGDMSDVWSDDIPGRIVKIRLKADNADGPASAWGFRLDRVANGSPRAALAESTHVIPSRGEFEWTIANPNPTAKYTKLHFARLDICCRDEVVLYDFQGNHIQTLKGDERDFWSSDVPGRVVRVKLLASGADAQSGWGFRIDDTAPDEEPT